MRKEEKKETVEKELHLREFNIREEEEEQKEEKTQAVVQTETKETSEEKKEKLRRKRKKKLSAQRKQGKEHPRSLTSPAPQNTAVTRMVSQPLLDGRSVSCRR